MMRKMIRTLFILSAFVFAVSVSTSAVAAVPSNPKIAVINFVKLVQESKAGKGVRSKIEAHKKQLLDRSKGQEAKLRKDQEALAKKSKVLSPESFVEQKQSLERDVTKFRVEAREAIEKVNKENIRVMEKMRETVLGILNEMMKEQKIDAVLPAQQMVTFQPNLDITNEVLKRLDSKLPSISVNLPKVQ
jgi:Skp family chaperone for outer membrane proteins